MGLARKRFDIGRIDQPHGTHVPRDNFLQVLFEERNVALRHLNHARAVGMAAGNWRAKIRQASRNHCSQVPRTINSDLHASFPCSPRKPAPNLALKGLIQTTAPSLTYPPATPSPLHARE